MRSSRGLEIVVIALAACSRPEQRSERSPAPSAAAAPAERGVSAKAQAAPSAAESPKNSATSAPNAAPPSRYAWRESEAGRALEVVGSLESRFPPPPGYARTPLPAGSFGEWLRGLPIAPPGTAVTAHDGSVIRSGDDAYVAGVIAIDVGSGDLQQSADVIVRLQAEWLWSRDEKQAIGYRGPSKLSMPLSRWEKGQRLVAGGPTSVYWAVKTKPKEVDYPEFRRYLDAVFAWVNGVSLAQRSDPVDAKELTPGDFFLHARAPAHVAIVVDVAQKPSGERVALLAQALNPAQSIHVLRPGRATPWFSLRPGSPVVTPYTREFAWTELRRLAPLAAEEPEGDAGATPPAP